MGSLLPVEAEAPRRREGLGEHSESAGNRCRCPECNRKREQKRKAGDHLPAHAPTRPRVIRSL